MTYILIGDDADVSDAQVDQVHADLASDPLSEPNGGADHLEGILLLLSLPGWPRAELRRSGCSGRVRELVNSNAPINVKPHLPQLGLGRAKVGIWLIKQVIAPT